MRLRRVPSSTVRALCALLMLILLPAALPAVAAGTPVPSGPGACANGLPATWTKQMDAYAAAGAYPAAQTQQGSTIASVLVTIPAIDFTGDGQSATLPVGPCQTIYRFAYSDVSAPAGAVRPFNYAEIDWNTEGEPRGPNNSFVSPHFDFHFYMEPRSEIDQKVNCVSTNGRTCDQFKTSYAQMRRFQAMPPAEYVPSNYRPDVGSAIPMMGLHLLDADFDYTVENVNHNPTLIYGTFDGQIIFAESSVTLYTLQDVIAAPDHRLSWTFSQPAAFAKEVDWPTSFVIQYDPATGTFQAGFAGFRHHAATSAA